MVDMTDAEYAANEEELVSHNVKLEKVSPDSSQSIFNLIIQDQIKENENDA